MSSPGGSPGDRSPPTGGGLRAARAVALWGACAALLSWVLLWNGYPILMGDTAAYFMVLDGRVSAFRPSGYPLVLALFLAGSSTWPIAALQVGAMALLLVRFLQLDLGLRPPALLAGAAAIAALTTLPWWSATLMSDVWCGVVALAAGLLLFRWSAMGRLERAALALGLAVALTFHITYFATTALLLAALFALHAAGRVAIDLPKRLWPAAAALPLLAGLFFPGLNYLGNDVFRPSVGGEAAVLARFAADGLVVPLLRERCPGAGYVLCDDIEALERFVAARPPPGPRNQWPCPCSAEGYVNYVLLWEPGSPLRRALEAGQGRDLRRVLVDSVRHDPVGHVRAVVGGTRDLFFDAVLTPFIDGTEDRAHFLPARAPEEHAAYLRSRSVQGRLRTASFNRVLFPALVLGSGVSALALALVVFLPARQRAALPPEWQALLRSAVFFLIFAAANAFVLYTLVGDHTRYQSRCSWMVAMQPLLAAALALQRRGGRRA